LCLGIDARKCIATRYFTSNQHGMLTQLLAEVNLMLKQVNPPNEAFEKAVNSLRKKISMNS